jgi:hypothetical protein
VKVLRIHGCHAASSPRSHHATETVPSAFSLILPSSSSSYWKRRDPERGLRGVVVCHRTWLPPAALGRRR